MDSDAERIWNPNLMMGFQLDWRATMDVHIVRMVSIMVREMRIDFQMHYFQPSVAHDWDGPKLCKKKVKGNNWHPETIP